jgi:hypothetical protein
MNLQRSLRGPGPAELVAITLALLLAGCFGPPKTGIASDSLVVTEVEQGLALDAADSPERAAARTEIRRQAAAAEALPDPNGDQAGSMSHLAARPEPRSVAEVRAIEAELALVAERRASATDAAEIAALEERAEELRRLGAAAQDWPVRQ